MKTVEQIEDYLRTVEQQRQHAEDHGPAAMALVRSGQEMALLWVLGRDAELAASLGMSEGDIAHIAARFGGFDFRP